MKAEALTDGEYASAVEGLRLVRVVCVFSWAVLAAMLGAAWYWKWNAGYYGLLMVLPVVYSGLHWLVYYMRIRSHHLWEAEDRARAARVDQLVAASRRGK